MALLLRVTLAPPALSLLVTVRAVTSSVSVALLAVPPSEG